MRHSQYTTYFREIARRHVAIGHTDQQMHFARIVLSQDGFGGDNLSELLNAMKSKMKFPFMVLVSYDHSYQDNRSDNIKKQLEGAFIILDKAEAGNFNQEEQILDRTEEIGEQILAFMKADFAANMATGQLDLNATGGEKIGHLANNFLGTRFHFSFVKTANQALHHNPLNWID